jgi:hypothetical protein
MSIYQAAAGATWTLEGVTSKGYIPARKPARIAAPRLSVTPSGRPAGRR